MRQRKVVKVDSGHPKLHTLVLGVTALLTANCSPHFLVKFQHSRERRSASAGTFSSSSPPVWSSPWGQWGPPWTWTSLCRARPPGGLAESRRWTSWSKSLSSRRTGRSRRKITSGTRRQWRSRTPWSRSPRGWCPPSPPPWCPASPPGCLSLPAGRRPKCRQPHPGPEREVGVNTK